MTTQVEQLRQLARAGDREAAHALLVEAARRNDLELMEVAQRCLFEPAPAWPGFALVGRNEQGFAELRHARTGLIFVEIPAGEYRLGHPREAANPERTLTLPSYLIAKFPVTGVVFLRAFEGATQELGASMAKSRANPKGWRHGRRQQVSRAVGGGAPCRCLPQPQEIGIPTGNALWRRASSSPERKEARSDELQSKDCAGFAAHLRRGRAPQGDLANPSNLLARRRALQAQPPELEPSRRRQYAQPNAGSPRLAAGRGTNGSRGARS